MARIKTIAGACMACLLTHAGLAQDKAPYKAGQKTVTETTSQTANGLHSAKAKKFRHKVKKQVHSKTSQGEVRHNAPDQQKIDSIKAAKTRLKK